MPIVQPYWAIVQPSEAIVQVPKIIFKPPGSIVDYWDTYQTLPFDTKFSKFGFWPVLASKNGPITVF